MSKHLIVLLHGVGSRGRDLEGLAQHWQRALENVIVATPDGPSAFDMGAGFQWFSVSGITYETRPARIAAARDAFDATISALYKHYDINPEQDRVILAGFSQGAMMALDALVRGCYQLAGVVAFSGRLASPEPLQPQANSTALLVHGSADQVISCVESRKAAETLSAAGVTVELHVEEGTPHTVSAAGVATAITFFKKQFDLVG